MNALRSLIAALVGFVRRLVDRLPLVLTTKRPARDGRWGPVFGLPNVAIHTSLLPDGKVLFWGRRDDPGDSMNEHSGTPYVWDPVNRTSVATPQPRRADDTTVNLFCAGHAYLPDGRLLVAGGHITDGDGIDYAGTYDHTTDTWTPLPVMNGGRWYPTATSLADGRVLVISGSAAAHGTIEVNADSQITDGESWAPTVDFVGLPLYPRMHVAPDGRVLMAGSNAMSYLLDTRGGGTWTPIGARANGSREYGPRRCTRPARWSTSAAATTRAPTCRPPRSRSSTSPSRRPRWRPATPMHHRRRQHNTTLLPDGTVLVTGGTGGPGFNDVSPGKPVHTAELWDPATDAWTTLAAEAVDRCYHATALLLPDATVLSAGGGEFMAGPVPNAPADTHRNAQIFRPPYLFRGPRPVITTAPSELTAGAAFTVEVTGPPVTGMTLMRLGSVTHAIDMNQRCIPLPVTGTRRPPSPPRSPPSREYACRGTTALRPDGGGRASVASIVRIAVSPTHTPSPTRPEQARRPPGCSPRTNPPRAPG